MSFRLETKNERANDLKPSEADGTTYFDENESRFGGSQIDEATGKAYRNDRSMDASSPEKSLVTTGVEFKDVVGEDETEKWLREHDPEYDKNSKKWGKN